MSDQGEFTLQGANGGNGTEGEEISDTSVEGMGQAVLRGKAEGPLKALIDSNFLQYASYVIRDRAIPDLDDGLKPVQRRILYSLHENDDGKFVKVANIAGYCMQYHPHGNVSIEDALCNVANKRHLIEGQGNFGNLYTGDPPAASRYIECRLTELARTQLFDAKLTRFVLSYDGRRKEPVSLPSKLPLLLMMGTEGIAVGLSTRVLPHNFGELLQAQIAILQKKNFELYPDFLQGGLIEVSEYENGNGKLKVRAVIERSKERQAVIIREIPFSTNTDSLISSIEDAARKKKVKIKSINDYTAEIVEIEVQLAPGEDANKTIQALYAFTNCEVSVSCRAVVIHNGRPVEMDVKSILQHNTKRLVQLLRKELQNEQKRLEDELHFKTLAQLFVEHRIYKNIEDCETYPEVQRAVLDGLNAFRAQLKRDVTIPDAEKLLAIPIKRISKFDIQKNRKEIGDIIAALDKVAENLEELIPYSIRYLKALYKKYAKDSPRLTRIETFEQVERRELISEEYEIGWDRAKGYLGHSVSGDASFPCTSYDKILLVWQDGRYKIVPVPEKLYVGEDLLHCAVFDRNTEHIMIFTYEQVTYLKRFTFGGVIMNREYECALPGARVILFEVGHPKEVFVKYKPAKGQRINQQIFEPGKVPVKSAKARGNQITVKEITLITSTRPKGWRSGKNSPRGVMMDT